MPRHVMKILAPGTLALLGLAACAHHGVKPAAPAGGAMASMTTPSAATSTHAISATHEIAAAAAPPAPVAKAAPPPTAASTMAAAATSANPPAASMPANASSTAAPAASTAAQVTPASATEAAVAPSASATATPAVTATSAATASTAAAPVTEMGGPSLPTRGMSMANVEHIFGAPLQKLPAVPDPGTKLHPPITRWIYPTYVVYFEYNYVVHTVLKTHPFRNGDPHNP